MPEGPEIHRTGDQLQEALAGKKAKEIFFAFDHLKKYEEKLQQEKISEITPRGKAIIVRFENDLNIYSHNQLYGKWMVREAGDIPETNRQLRIAIHNSEYSALLYSASDIEVLTDNELSEHAYLKKLGPDVLSPDTNYEQILERLQSSRFKNRKLATLFLDQGFVGGIGNYLRSEIMFYARVNPFKRPGDLSLEKLKTLAKTAVKIARRSYETGGITTDPAIVEALKNEGKGRKDYRRSVYKRNGKFCFKCGTAVRMDKTGGRKLYYCPSCQNVEDH